MHSIFEKWAREVPAHFTLTLKLWRDINHIKNLDYFTALENLLDRLQQQDPQQQWRIAIEFRNASWYVGETYELLNQYNAAIVVHDHPKAKSNELVTSVSFVYCRFHGPNGNYRERYTD